jgi:hypothetical protein
METRNMIQLFIPAVKTLYGGPEAVRCSCSGSVFSSSVMLGASAVLACCFSISSLPDSSFFVSISLCLAVSLSLSCPFFWEPKEAEEVSELLILGVAYGIGGGEDEGEDARNGVAWRAAAASSSYMYVGKALAVSELRDYALGRPV